MERKFRFLILVCWAGALTLRRCSLVYSSYSLSYKVYTLGDLADKHGDSLGGATLGSSGDLGDINGDGSTLGSGSTLESATGSGGKSESGGGIGRLLGEARTGREHATIKPLLVTMVVIRGERRGCCGEWESGGVVWWPMGRGKVDS